MQSFRIRICIVLCVCSIAARAMQLLSSSTIHSANASYHLLITHDQSIREISSDGSFFITRFRLLAFN